MVQIKVDPFPTDDELNALWREAWDSREVRTFGPLLSHSLVHVGAYEGLQLVGFVNVAWDGQSHAFVLDTCVHPNMRRQGIGTGMIKEATRQCTDRGIIWLHVDFEPHLTSFYRGCGFGPTEAGLLKLR